VLLAGEGAIVVGAWIHQKSARLALAAAILLAAVAAGSHYRCYSALFGEFNARPQTVVAYHTDLVEACEWLRPRFDGADSAFCTTLDMNMPYVVMMVALEYDPRQWFCDERRTITFEPWECYTQVGKIYFMYTGHDTTHDNAWGRLAANATEDRVIVIARPGEVALADPVHTIRDREGEPRLLIYKLTL